MHQLIAIHRQAGRFPQFRVATEFRRNFLRKSQRKGTGSRSRPGNPLDKLIKSLLLTKPFGESRMFRWLLALPLTLALVASSIFLASCSSSGTSPVRVLNAIPDGPEVDVSVNGSKSFTQLSFESISPGTQPGYTNVPSGGVTVQAFLTGTSHSAPPEST